MIQTDETLCYVDLSVPKEIQSLVSGNFSVKLEVLRGLNDNFYFARRDDGATSDSLFHLKFRVNPKKHGSKIKILQEGITAPCIGMIIALELDPLNSNDIENFQQDNDYLDEFKDKVDIVYVIDGRLTLFKLSIERDVRVLNRIDLTNFKRI